MELSRTSLKNNPIEWKWVIAAVAISSLLPEYLAPAMTLIAFCVMKHEFGKIGRKLKYGTTCKILLFYTAYMAIGVFYSGTKIYSFFIVLLWIGMMLGQVIVSNLALTKQKLDSALEAVSVSGGVVGFIGILEMAFSGKPFTFPNPFWSFLDKIALDILPVQINTRFITERANSTFENPNVFASFMVIIFPLAIYSFFNEKNKKRKWILLISIVLILGGIVTTYSRGAYIAILISAVILFFLGKKQTAFISIIGALMLVTVPDKFFDRISSLGPGDTASMIRIDIWKSCYKIIKENFFFGIGPGVQNVWNILLSRFNIDQPHAHNIFIELFVEGGIFGVLIFCVFLFFFFKDMVLLLKNCKESKVYGIVFISSMVGFLSFGMTDFLLMTPKEVQYFMFLLGFAEAAKRIYLKTIGYCPVIDDDKLKKANAKMAKATVSK